MSTSPEKPPLVLLHGLGTGPSGWAPQRERLSRSRLVLTPTLFDPGTAVARLDSLLAEHAVERADLCGLSLGGQLALRYALERRVRVCRLVVCAGFARLPPRLRAFVRLSALAFRVLPRGVVLRGLVGDLPARHRALALEELGRVRKSQLARAMSELGGWDLRAGLHHCEVPTLVVCGEGDRHNLPLGRELAALLPGGEFRTIRAAGHVANLDAPAEFTAVLEEFLDRDQGSKQQSVTSRAKEARRRRS